MSVCVCVRACVRVPGCTWRLGGLGYRVFWAGYDGAAAALACFISCLSSLLLWLARRVAHSIRVFFWSGPRGSLPPVAATALLRPVWDQSLCVPVCMSVCVCVCVCLCVLFVCASVRRWASFCVYVSVHMRLVV